MYVLDEKKVSNQQFKLPLQEFRKKKKKNTKTQSKQGKGLNKNKSMDK